MKIIKILLLKKMLTYHGTFELLRYADDHFNGIQLVINFLSGKTEYVCVYIGDCNPVYQFLEDKIDGSKIRLDGFSNIDPEEGIDCDFEDDNCDLIKMLEERYLKSSMILRWKDGALYATSICGTEESDVGVYKVNETNVFDALGIEIISDIVMESDCCM